MSVIVPGDVLSHEVRPMRTRVMFHLSDQFPPYMEELILRDDHRRLGEMSVTELLDHPRCALLRKLHPECKEDRDPKTQVASLIGKAVHHYFETKLVIPGLYKELSVIIPPDLALGWTISGTIDQLDMTQSNKIIIRDMKVWNTFKWSNRKLDSLIAQLSLYLLGVYEWCRLNGVETKGLRPVLEAAIMFKDWKLSEKFKTNLPYPENPRLLASFQPPSRDSVVTFLQERVKAHQAIQALPESEWPDADEEATWQQTTAVKVYKKGGKRATGGGVFPVTQQGSVEEAMRQAQQKIVSFGLKAKEYEIRMIRSDRTRCRDYCPVAHLCTSYQAYCEANHGESDETTTA